MRILFDKNVPVGVRRFLPQHEVHTVVEIHWPERLKNGELLKAAVDAGFDAIVTCDQNIRHQQNLAGQQLALVTLGSNIWRLVQSLGDEIAQAVDAATPGSYSFIEIALPQTPERTAALGLS